MAQRERKINQYPFNLASDTNLRPGRISSFASKKKKEEHEDKGSLPSSEQCCLEMCGLQALLLQTL